MNLKKIMDATYDGGLDSFDALYEVLSAMPTTDVAMDFEDCFGVENARDLYKYITNILYEVGCVDKVEDYKDYRTLASVLDDFDIEDVINYLSEENREEWLDFNGIHKDEDHVSDSTNKVADADFNYAKEGNYTHYAVDKEKNLIIEGWDYHGYDSSELRQFKRDYFYDDLEGTFDDIDLKRVTILTENGCVKRGIDPFDNGNWTMEYPTKQ